MPKFQTDEDQNNIMRAYYRQFRLSFYIEARQECGLIIFSNCKKALMYPCQQEDALGQIPHQIMI